VAENAYYVMTHVVNLDSDHTKFTQMHVLLLSVYVPPSGGRGGVERKGIAKYSDFGPFEGYISEMVQDRR